MGSGATIHRPLPIPLLLHAALRAIADQREGTARQEGHIKSLAARLEANAEEIARLTTARSEAQSRVDQAKAAYSQFEMEIAGADAGELGLDSQFEVAKSALDSAKKKHAELVDAERAADRERNAVESKLEAMRITSQSRDGAAALVRDSRGVNLLGSIASLIQIDSGWEAATAAALGTLADAVVVRDINAAVTALTTLRSENLGQADVLVYEPGAHSSSNVPGNLTSLLSHVRSSQISELLTQLLGSTVVVENARDAESILREHKGLTVVTRDGDVITAHRARGGSASSNSLVEIQALINDLESQLAELTRTCDRLKFEISTAAAEVESKQSDFDAALAQLNEIFRRT